MTKNSEIERELEKLKPAIDKAIERNIPRSFSGKNLERIAGKPRYAHDSESITGAIAKPIWNLLDRGGKRPALTLMTIEALGKNPKKFVDFAVIPEVIHNGTILADDIEDNSEFRRGKPTVHKIYGNDIAINASNAMYFLPLKIIMESTLEPKKKNELYETIAQELINVSIGQATDIYWHRGLRKKKASEKEYMQMCAYKTGCLMRMAAKIGAILADATEQQKMVLAEFSEAVGVAFQIQDDILNLTAGSEYGKEIGGDITEGKITLMAIHAFRHSPKAARLKQIIQMHTREKQEVDEAIRIMKEAGSIEYAERTASQMVSRSWATVEKTIPENPGKRKLKALVGYLIQRKR